MDNLKFEGEWHECDGTEVAGSSKRTLGLYSIRGKIPTPIGVYQLEKSLYDGTWWYYKFYGVNGERRLSGLVFGEDTPSGIIELKNDILKWAADDFNQRVNQQNLDDAEEAT